MKTIKLGYEGEEALLLCRELKRNGYSVKESRTFTQEMKEAVIDFQQKNKLDADGIVGYRTWEVLFFTGHPITERLTEEDFILVARLLDVEVAALKAVQQVETGGRGGFFAPGKPAILFEGHIFWNQLKKRNINPESHVKGNENILYPIKFELKENCGLKKSGEQTVKLVHHSLLSSYFSEKYFKNWVRSNMLMPPTSLAFSLPLN